MKLTKYGDVTTIHETSTVDIPVGDQTLRFEIRTLPLDVDLIIQQRLPGPTDIEDPPTAAQVLELEILDRRRVLASILMSISPGQIELDTHREDFDDDDWQGYYQAVIDELTEFGFGILQFNLFTTAMQSLNKMSGDDIKGVESNFTDGSQAAS